VPGAFFVCPKRGHLPFHKSFDNRDRFVTGIIGLSRNNACCFVAFLITVNTKIISWVARKKN